MSLRRGIQLAVLTIVGGVLLALSSVTGAGASAEHLYVGTTSQGHEIHFSIARDNLNHQRYIHNWHIDYDVTCSDGSVSGGGWSSNAGGYLVGNRWRFRYGATEYLWRFRGLFGPGNGNFRSGSGTFRLDEWHDPVDGVRLTCTTGDVSWTVHRVR